MENLNRPATIGQWDSHRTANIDFSLIMIGVVVSVWILMKAVRLMLHFWVLWIKYRDVLEENILQLAAIVVKFLVVVMLFWSFIRPLGIFVDSPEVLFGVVRDPYSRELLLTIALLVIKRKPLTRNECGSVLSLCLLYAMGSGDGGGWFEGILRMFALWTQYRGLVGLIREGRRYDIRGGGDSW